ncbi:MAG: hypothetical protein WEB04_02120 [Dehalococcoidia bacterium]
MASITPSPPTILGPSSLRVVYLQRLQRLLRLRREHEQELNQQGLRLLDRSLFAAYCACRDAGAEEEARAILRREGIHMAPPERELRSAS